MSMLSTQPRYLLPDEVIPEHLRLPLPKLQPILAKPGTPTQQLLFLQEYLKGKAELLPPIAIESPSHWQQVISTLDDSIDAILPLSVPAYPTEIWNEHPEALAARHIPVVFWSLTAHDEPDFWRFAPRDLLRTLGVEVYLAQNNAHALQIVRALAVRRFLRGSKLILFGEQNFPWNALAAGSYLQKTVGIESCVKPLSAFRAQYAEITDAQVDAVWALRKADRYVDDGLKPEELRHALRTYLAIRTVLLEEKAIGFGVNCFGDLIIQGGRDVPCLAQVLLREEGFVAACDGDFIALAGLAISSYYLNIPGMISNLYPVSYVGALQDHFGDPLSPHAGIARSDWKDHARFAHCGYIGIISPEMTAAGKVRLSDWGGTYEIKRDGHGVGIDGELAAEEPITAFSLRFAADHLMATGGTAVETTRHPHLRHCESSALLRLENLPAFSNSVSRDHIVVVYGDRRQALETLATVLGLRFTDFTRTSEIL